MNFEMRMQMMRQSGPSNRSYQLAAMARELDNVKEYSSVKKTSKAPGAYSPKKYNNIKSKVTANIQTLEKSKKKYV